MAVTLDNLLSSPVITDVISRIKTPLSRFQDFYGLGMGGANTNQVGGRTFGWDIFDNVRTIATARPFGTGPASVAPRPIGTVTAIPHRSHEQVALLEDKLYRTRPLGGGLGEIDVRGQRYVQQQAEKLAQRFKNMREFLVSRALRGSLMLKFEGEDWIPVDTGGQITVNFQVPATHTGQLNGIINLSWANIAALIHTDLAQLNAYSEEESGYPIRHVWINSVLWGNILANTQIKDLGGTANTVFAQYDRVNPESTEFIGVLRGVPWLQWHIYDGGVTVNGTFTKFLPDTAALFTPEPSGTWLEMMEGSEIVKENVMDNGSERFGFTAWSTNSIDPASIQLKALDICLPVLRIPKAIFYGTVVF